MDSLDDLPPDSRSELVKDLRALLDVDSLIAEAIIRASEPLWQVLEDAGGFVDSWGGGQFCSLLP